MITLLLLFAPKDLESISVIPTASQRALTGPPAIIPVPGVAGRSTTSALLNLPIIS